MSTSFARLCSTILALLTALCLVACAPSVSPARVAQVKRVAIVSFEGGQGELAARYYAGLGSHLASAMGWEVLPEAEVVSSPATQQLLHGGDRGGFGAMLANGGSPGLFSFTLATMLEAPERAALVKGLRVDAIALARLYFYGGSSTSSANGLSLGPRGVGLGSDTSQAYSVGVQFYLYDGEGLIWSDLQAKGHESREGKPGEAPALIDGAAQSSFAALTDRYRAAAR